MDAGLLGLIIPLSALIGGAIGWWLGRKRQAALDAVETLHRKKLLLEEMLSKEAGTDREQSLCAQLDDVNHELLALYSERIRRTLRGANLPEEEILIARGREQLSPEQATNLEEAAAEVAALPVTPSVRDLLALAGAYYYAGRYDKTLDALNRSLELQPDNPVTLMKRGVAYDELGRYEEALADYNHSLELRPDYPDTLTNRGTTYSNMGRYEEALADFNRALELQPDHLATFYNLVYLFLLQGKPDEAKDYLEKAIAGDEKYREMAKTDEDFNNIREDPRFKKLVEPD